MPSLLLSYCNRGKQKNANQYLNVSDSAKYVGMKTCMQCHTDKHSTFIHTGMGQSWGEATPLKSAGKNWEHAFVFDANKNFWYHPSWRNDSLFIEQYRLENHDTVYKRTEYISYIVGSGQHTNSHVWQSNGYLFQAPITFYTQQGIWDLAPGAADQNSFAFNRIISVECMNCHNMYPQFDFASQNKFITVENGIECERCHGPGSIHVQEKFEGHLVNTKDSIDYTIVNPAKLPRDLQTELCQRCHMQGITVLNEGKTFFDFKPGMKLNEVMNVFMPRYTTDQTFIMASHADRLKQSQCYQNTSTLTCITCHNPHVSVKETPQATFNNTCITCHHQTCTEKKELIVEAENNCVQCHMPLSNAMDIPHVQIHDHKIGIHHPSDSTTQSFTFLQCMTTTTPSALLMAQGYLAMYESYVQQPLLLDSASMYLNQCNENNQQVTITKIHFYFLKDDFSNVIKIADALDTSMMTDAWTSYRMAESYLQKQNTQQALPWFLHAVHLMNHEPEFLNKLSVCYLTMKQTPKAMQTLQLVLTLNPKNDEALCNLGYCKLLEGKLNDAIQLYQQSLSINPDNITALLNTGGWYYINKQPKVAITYFQRVLSIDGKNIQALAAIKAIQN